MPISPAYHILWEVFIKKIILTGGGTAGHVIPSLVLLPSLKEAGYEVRYIDSCQSMERKLTRTAGIPYDGMSSDKLRRYFDIKDFSDPFRVAEGYTEARRFLKRHKPDVIFFEGGFVAVPVALATKHYKIPVIIRESDATPGLAGKIYIPLVLKVCCNSPETLKYLPFDKAVLTDSPVCTELLQSDRPSELSYVHLSAGRPVLPVIGGSSGSVAVNTMTHSILPRFLFSYQAIHVYGKSNLGKGLIGTVGYVQYEYVDAPSKHLFTTVDLVISRAGTNSICGLLALRKPSLFIPLSTTASHGDQILNASSLAKQGFGKVLEGEVLSDDSLSDVINDLYLSHNSYIQAMERSNPNNTVKAVVSFIESHVE